MSVASTSSQDPRAEVYLAEGADTRRLLAQIAHGVMLAHARIDLMEGRVSAATSAAAKAGIDEHLAPVTTLHRSAAEASARLVHSIDELKDVRGQLVSSAEDGARHGTISGLHASLGPIEQAQQRAATTVSELASTLQSLTAIEVRLLEAAEIAASSRIRQATEVLECAQQDAHDNILPKLIAAANACETLIGELKVIQGDLGSFAALFGSELNGVSQAVFQRFSDAATSAAQAHKEILGSNDELKHVLLQDAQRHEERMRIGLKTTGETLANDLRALQSSMSNEAAHIKTQLGQATENWSRTTDNLRQVINQQATANSRAILDAQSEAAETLAHMSSAHAAAIGRFEGQHKKTMILLAILVILTTVTTIGALIFTQAHPTIAGRSVP